MSILSHNGISMDTKMVAVSLFQSINLFIIAICRTTTAATDNNNYVCYACSDQAFKHPQFAKVLRQTLNNIVMS
jgi:hypothetical protein